MRLSFKNRFYVYIVELFGSIPDRRISRELDGAGTRDRCAFTVVQLSKLSNGKQQVATVTVTVQMTQRSHTLNELAVGTEYMRVRAVSDAGVGKWSEISVATTFNCELTLS